jgi:hypothetical protein
MSDESVLNNSVNEVVAEAPNATENLSDFVNKVSKKFIENKIDSFPAIVAEFRYENMVKQKELEAVGNEKGWSENKDFMLDYIIPRELYFFMVNLVYRDFWGEENEKVWRPFLKHLMSGDDPLNLLIRVKAIYGSTADAEKAGIV